MGVIPLRSATDPELCGQVARDVAERGVAAATGAVDDRLLDELREVVDRGVEAEDVWNTMDRPPAELGRVVFLPHHGRAALDLLAEPRLMQPCDAVLEPGSILYTMTSLCHPAHGGGRPVHVDTQYVAPGFVMGLGVMVLLDDFTAATGPTRFHPEVTVEAPSPEDFERRALRLEAPAGSACWFHGRIWHYSLPNTTDRARRAVLAAMVRPYLRQRLDMPRMVAHLNPESLPTDVQHRLGFDKILPGSYEEYFLPDGIRKQELLRRSIARERTADDAGFTPG